MNLSNAIIVATGAHEGQVDKQGRPYILHPLRVMLAGTTEDEMIVGVLHDVIEDTEVEMNDLRHLGFSFKVRQAIHFLTKYPGTSHEDYLSQLIDEGPELARRVKMNDARDNLRPGLMDHEYDKYRETIHRLEEAE